MTNSRSHDLYWEAVKEVRLPFECYWELLGEQLKLERQTTTRLKKLLDIREMLRDAAPALRDEVDKIIGKDILTLASIHGQA